MKRQLAASRLPPGRNDTGSTPRRKQTLRDVMIPLLEHIDRLRLKSGLSQKDMAARVGLSQPTFSSILTGTRMNLRLKTLHEFVAAIGMDLHIAVRFQCPLAEIDDHTTLFECYCGWHSNGPAGHLHAGPGVPYDFEPGTGRWRLWAARGSEFAGDVHRHVATCPHGSLRYVVQWPG